MILGLLIGCNNGLAEELTAEKRLGEIGRSAENVFYSFVDLIADTLGLRVTAETNKSEVESYFSGLGEKIGKASEELEKVAKTAEVEGSRDESIALTIRTAVEAAKATLNKLKEHLDILKGIGGEQKVGVAASHTGAKQGVASEDGELKKVLKAFQGIVDEAGKLGFAKPEVGNKTLDSGADNSAGAKILSTNSGVTPGTGDAAKAALIVSAVSGEEILDAIVKSTEKDPQISGGGADGNTTAVSFAKGNSVTTVAQTSAKATALAGGIALRSLVKTGTLAAAANTGQGGPVEVQGVGITAVNKLLGAVEDIIKKTVKKVLEKAKAEIDQARDSKAIVQK